MTREHFAGIWTRRHAERNSIERDSGRFGARDEGRCKDGFGYDRHGAGAGFFVGRSAAKAGAAKSMVRHVYNAKGYFELNPLNAYTVNNIAAKAGADGSIAIQFGGCDDKIANCLPTSVRMELSGSPLSPARGSS